VSTTFVDGTTPLDAVHMNALQQKVEKGAANGYAALDGTGKVPSAQSGLPAVVNGQWLKGSGGAAIWSAIAVADVAGAEASANKGAVNGYAALDGTGKVPAGQLPASGGMSNPMTTVGDLIQGGAAGAPARLAIGAAGQRLSAVGGVLAWRAPASYSATPGDPTSTTNTGFIMAGLAGSITPVVSGVVMLLMSFDRTSGPLAVQAAYGPGGAPGNAAGAQGTVVGRASQYPVSVGGRISGLALGTAYWLDVQFRSVDGGDHGIRDVSVWAWEV
jgi:hypothetical protein